MNGEWNRMWQPSCCPKSGLGGEEWSIMRRGGVEETETRFVHRCQCQSVATTAAWHICSGNDGQEKSRQNRQMQRVAEWQHPKRVIRRGATSILWVVCVSVGYVVRIWRLYMRSQSATKNSQQNVKWNCSATRSVCCYCLLCSYLRCCCIQHTHTLTHRYADTFLEIQSRSAARDRSDSWSGLPLALWFMRAAQIHMHIVYTAGKHTPHFCLCILAFPESNLIFCLNCGRTNVEKFF